jgi:hypothetical protein
MVFQKIGAFREFLGNVGDYVKAGAYKALPHVENVTGALKHIPGSIGTTAGIIDSGAKAVRESIENVPNKQVQKKLSDHIDRSGEVGAEVRQRQTPVVHQVQQPRTTTLPPQTPVMIDAATVQIPRMRPRRLPYRRRRSRR